MLEVKNLRKQYKTKDGVVTNALDGVSLTFSETGMVFILGKSGSGKSTLLNVCGGLDKCDEGEIIIKNKSSAEFSAQDFDSYRNTYVGFVFQEYNILDEFTVEDNVALALELQGRKRDKTVIDAILEEVEMKELSKRKPNTLSGGQKQRVAIARALVKEPQIIMADEPTGALDSQTGQQVFDTLKKLSETKLVLVVSHDREFAEQYADRIIELKDGKVISDMQRSYGGKTQNVSFYGSNTVCVKDGSAVTDEELNEIKTFLNKSGGSVVITSSREKVLQIKSELPETNAGNFKEVEKQPVSKKYPEQKLIRSVFPMRHAIRMGASGLKTKPIRLVFTVILSVAAFILFGLASTLMLFNGRSVTVQTFLDANYDSVIIGKAFYQKTKKYDGEELQYEIENKVRTGFTVEEFTAMREKYGEAIAAVDINTTVSFDNVNFPSVAIQFYPTGIDGFVISDGGLTFLAGRAPEEIDEIAITDFTFDSFCLDGAELTCCFAGEKEAKTLTFTKGRYSEIVYSESNPVTLTLQGKSFKIVGVYKGGEIADDYEALKQATGEGRPYTEDYVLLYKWHQARSNGIYSRVAVSKKFVEKYIVSNGNKLYNADDYFFYSSSFAEIGADVMSDKLSSLYVNYMAPYKRGNEKKYLKLYAFNGEELESLEGQQVGINYAILADIYSYMFNTLIRAYGYDYNEEEKQRVDAVVKAAKEQYEAANPAPNPDDYGGANSLEYIYAHKNWQNAADEYLDGVKINACILKDYYLMRKEIEVAAKEQFKKDNPMPELNTFEYNKWETAMHEAVLRAISNEDLIYRLDDIREFSRSEVFSLFTEVKSLFLKLGLTEKLSVKNKNGALSEATVGGIYFETLNAEDYALYFSNDLFDVFYVEGTKRGSDTVYETAYDEPENAYISTVYVPYRGNGAIVGAMYDLAAARNKDDSSAVILNDVMAQLELLIKTAKNLATAFIISGLIFAAFAFLLMFNFISVSISSKKREIGILRAIGARTADVFKIFLSEAAIISLICFVLSTVGSLITCVILNSTITAETVIDVSLFVFSPLSVLCILAIALITALIATVIPVTIYSRKPPVDSIRSL